MDYTLAICTRIDTQRWRVLSKVSAAWMIGPQRFLSGKHSGPLSP